MNDLDLLERLKPWVFYDSLEKEFATVYGRVVGNVVQYWFWYARDWSPLPWRRGHVLDIEMVQYHCAPYYDPDGETGCGPEDRVAIVEAAYAQHSGGEIRGAMDMLWTEGRPHVYVALGRHASYFEPGWHWRTKVDVDFANGKKLVDPQLERASIDGWVRSHDASHAPGHTLKWRDPAAWATSLRR